MPQIYNRLYLKNAGSQSMAVDGSVTPVDFDIDFTGISSIEVVRANIYVESGGFISSYTDFMSLSPLVNGIGLSISISGTVFTDISIKSNTDLLNLFRTDQELRRRNTDQGIGMKNTIIGSFILPTRGAVLRSASDFFRVTINDDLTDLDNIFMTLEGNVL
jgi:hypothetical protein